MNFFLIYLRLIFQFLFLLLFLVSCESTSSRNKTSPSLNTNSIKNIILVIGDGMGPQQIGLLYLYAKHAPHSIYENRNSTLETILQDSQIGISFVEAYEHLTTDSAASATQLASGETSRPEMLGANEQGYSTNTILELAQQKGKKTGLVSNTRITHATPAAFIAHITNRKKEEDIALQLLNSQVDLMLSGGLEFWLPKDQDLKSMSGFTGKGVRSDQKNLIEAIQKNGYHTVFDLETLEKSKSSKILGLFSASEMPSSVYEYYNENNPQRKRPNLSEMTSFALNFLENDKNGFFLMVEGGLIDWAAHTNDTGALLHEMVRFDKTLKVIWSWIQNRQDTLLIITADHETGGFGFCYSNNNLTLPKILPGPLFQREPYLANQNYGSPSVLDKIFNQKKDYRSIFSEFDKLTHKTPAEFQKMINEATSFPITLKQAKLIIDESVDYNSKKPNANPFGLNDRFSLLAKTVSVAQQSRWSTTTHTSTPVYFITFGPEEIMKQFHGAHHTSTWGKKIMQIWKTN